MGGCRIYGLLILRSLYVRHPPILSSQEQLALKGLKTYVNVGIYLNLPFSELAFFTVFKVDTVFMWFYKMGTWYSETVLSDTWATVIFKW
jgi:hypothetical protein